MRIPNLGETELLVPLHEGVFEQPMWGTFLDRLRRAAGVDWAAFLVRSPQSESGNRQKLEMVSARGEPAVNLAPMLAGEGSIGEMMRTGRVYSLPELRDLASGLPALSVPPGTAHLQGMRVQDGSGFDGWLAVGGGEPIGLDVAGSLTALAPHLRSALKVYSGLEKERARASINAGAVSRMNFGWIAVDSRNTILDMDDRAQRLLQQSGVLRRGPYGRLTAGSPAMDRRLTETVKHLAGGQSIRPRALNLSQDPWIDILVSPVRHAAALPPARGQAAAVIYFRGDRSPLSDRHEQLVELFGLTPSEARLAWSIAQGLSIAEAAEQNGLTIETARNYSKKIYAKTGARGQVDLVRNILTGVLALA